MWIFGYGSLVWRPALPFAERRPGYVHGWRRRFWQGSTDHRGVPEAPGRVVTLLPAPARERCWGVVYRVEVGREDEVLGVLDHREQGGYERHALDVHDGEGRTISDVLVYVATSQNPNWLGEAPLEAIAEQVVASVGPSGPNTEYVLRLAEALATMGAEDPHVEELAARVRGLLR